MNLFIPEIIYNRIKTDLKFQEKYKKLDDKIIQNMNCIVTYSEFVEKDFLYKDLLNYLNLILNEKEKKIWNCFILSINYDEVNSSDDWKKIDDIIQNYKKDSDIDIKMYAYYMELANTSDHESRRWIKNIEESIELWKKYEERKFDVRLYTKYYWDHHEKLFFDNNNKKIKKNILKCYEEYEQLDLNLKSFLKTKHDSRYFWDIINHKTTYTSLMFWSSINNEIHNNVKESFLVLNKLNEKIINLDHKYSKFNMHLLEWYWYLFKYFLEIRDSENIIFVWNKILNITKEALYDRKKLIKSLTHHNFSYTTNFIIFFSNLYKIEKEIMKKYYKNTNFKILDCEWTNKEIKMITENDESKIHKYYFDTGQRKLTISNYKENMLNMILSQFK